MTDQKEIYCIMTELFLLEDVWERCLPFLQNPEIGEIEFSSLEELKQECLKGTAQLWILMEGDDLVGCFCTNIGEVSDSVKVCNIFYLSGSGAKNWVGSLDKKIADFAKQQGCKFYLCTARKGFARLVPQLKEAGTLFVRDLCKEN